jgi:rubrerythrin
MDRIDPGEDRKSAKVLAELETVQEIISFAIARERASADYYLRAYEKAKTEATRKAFSLLLEQEREHEKLMRAQYEELKKEIARIRKRREE